ncbi:MAG TPA: YihY/virulence factor BrkB family protein [Anaerohalosphaeraceae bacterium]|nr:YihY/virulence factor BrkB family protein [Anaerohalosphaeraceae bacterium]HRT51633.1 YihY/virulence factor BrkB family protein [Anaerohalosphaeraceae bacterium]HRT87342.1 YihY/virulence factor BrkB family protein [Anaerohalosphaeraceae bacterium]
MTRLWQANKQALMSFLRDDCISLAAALAFFSMLSLAPLLVLLVTAGAYIGRDNQARIVDRVQSALGPPAGDALQQMLANAEAHKVAATYSAVIGITSVLIGATIVFGHLQKSLNRAFNVRTKTGLIAGWFYKRGLSLLMVIGIGILLLASLVISSVLSALSDRIPVLAGRTDFLLSLVLFVLAFALMYKTLPDVRIAWRDVWIGSLITALLFVIAKWAIATYLARQAVASAYGAAGALFVLMLWAFYSGIVILYGAELTKAWTECCGTPLEPNQFAEWDK